MTIKHSDRCACDELGPGLAAAGSHQHRRVAQETLDRLIAFHGHLCPGLSLGVQAATIALREIGAHCSDEEVIGVVESDNCAVDAIQFMTGCTFGKGNLIHRDWGKSAYSFYRQSDGRAIRVSTRPEAWDRDPEHNELMNKFRAGEANAEETARFRVLHREQSYKLLERDPECLFEITELHEDPPRKSRIFASATCSACGERVLAHCVERLRGRDLCRPCLAATRAGAIAKV